MKKKQSIKFDVADMKRISEALSAAYTKRESDKIQKKKLNHFCKSCKRILKRYSITQERAQRAAGPEPKDQKHLLEDVRRKSSGFLAELMGMQERKTATWHYISNNIYMDWLNQHSEGLKDAHLSAALLKSWEWKADLPLNLLTTVPPSDDAENEAYAAADKDFNNLIASMIGTLKKLKEVRGQVGNKELDLSTRYLWRHIALQAAAVCGGNAARVTKGLHNICRAVAVAATIYPPTLDTLRAALK